MDIDRQAIERRDFPIVRRGYEPAAVDAHLRALAAEVEELSRKLAGGAEASVATAASSQVQSILHAAETAAADIEREASEGASKARGDAERDARRTREDAIAHARTHVAALEQATATLLERVGSLDGEVSGLLKSVRGGAERLTRDLTTVDANMGELYDSAAGRARSAEAGEPLSARAGRSPREAEPPSGAAPAAPPDREPALARAEEPSPAAAEPIPAAGNGDIDGARLVALNMALSGESRAAVERYLEEHFELAERDRLIDEVYAAIEE